MILYKDWSYLSTGLHGEMDDGPLEGFFAAGTQFLTHYRIRVNGRELAHTFSAPTSPNTWAGVFSVPGTIQEGDLPEGIHPRGGLEVRILRRVDGAWSESLKVRNYDIKPARFRLSLEFGCPLGDAEDKQEAHRRSRHRYIGVPPKISSQNGGPTLRYERLFGRRRRTPDAELARLYGEKAPHDGDPVRRALDVQFRGVPSQSARVSIRRGPISRVEIILKLPARGASEVLFDCTPEIDGVICRPDASPPRPVGSALEGPSIATGNSTFNLILAQARTDLESLQLPALGPCGTPARALTGLAAGIPRYVGIFARDMLTAGWQSSLLSHALLENILDCLALYKGIRRDPWRDEEPDRIIHEHRWNPNAVLGKENRELYYGDDAATPFWIVALASLYNWTGDRGLLERHRETFESSLRWIEQKLDEGRGFVYYATRSPIGNRHHAWKDSGDAIVDGEGRICVPPLATAEIQGYCHLAFMAGVELALAQGRPDRARDLYRRAGELRKRFNEAFWMPQRRFYAMALDSKRRQIDAISSNIGHCLACGIIDADRRAAVVDRLMAPDVFSGWGIRTLSSENPAFAPFSYHRGSVWPVENATIAAGFRLFGFDQAAVRVIESQLAAATMFPRMRLPEVMAGQPRSADYPVPGLYPQSNLLQAWSVSSVFLSLWTMLGLWPAAPIRTLLVRPYLPEWLPWIELRGLKVGRSMISLRFWRDAQGRNRWKVLERQGRLVVLEQAPLENPIGRLFRRFKRLWA